MSGNNNDIIEFLIECLVISKLSEHSDNTKKANRSILNKSFKNTLSLRKKMLDIQLLDKLIDVKLMENDYSNYNMTYSYSED
jgi:hypothetical protein